MSFFDLLLPFLFQVSITSHAILIGTFRHRFLVCQFIQMFTTNHFYFLYFPILLIEMLKFIDKISIITSRDNPLLDELLFSQNTISTISLHDVLLWCSDPESNWGLILTKNLVYHLLIGAYELDGGIEPYRSLITKQVDYHCQNPALVLRVGFEPTVWSGTLQMCWFQPLTYRSLWHRPWVFIPPEQA